MKPIFAAALTAFPSLLPAQDFSHDLSLSGIGTPAAANPFGLAFEHSTNRLYVAVAGTLSDSNNHVAVFDAATDTLLRTFQVGLYPEDIAFSYDAAGNLAWGAVTNSSSGSVTVWDASDDVVAEISLPDPLGLGTCFPFGIATGGPGFFVSTIDGTGDIHAIDLTSMDYHPTAGITAPLAAAGRLKVSHDSVWVPTTRYTPSWEGSEGGLATIPIGATTPATDIACVVKDGQWIYPNGQDVEILSDGRAILGGTAFFGQLFVFSPDGELDRAFRVPDAGDSHGLAVSPDETLLAICDLAGNRVILFDLVAEKQLAVIGLGGLGRGYSMPNDAVFAHDKLYVSCQGNEEIVVFNNLPTTGSKPGFAGSLDLSSTTPTLNQPITATVCNLTGGMAALLSAHDNVAGSYAGVPVHIGPAPVLQSWGMGSSIRTFRIPTTATWRGRTFHLQGGVQDISSIWQTTAPKTVILQ